MEISSFLLIFSMLVSYSSAYTFYAGGKDGWVLHPSESYSTWASRNRFQVNDTIVFKYKQGDDSVLLVTQQDYDSCNLNNPIQKMDTGDSTFKFDRSGPFYFISGTDNRCNQGQKLIVVVLAIRPPKSTPAPVVTPVRSPVSSPVAAPISSPVSSPVEAPISSPVSSPIGSPISSPVSSPVGAPIRSPVSSPIGAPIGSPVSSPIGAPIGSPVSSPIGAPKSSPVSSPIGAPISSPVSSPIGTPISSPTSTPTVSSPVGTPVESPSVSSPISSPINSPAEGPEGAAAGIRVSGIVMGLMVIFSYCLF